MPTLNVRPKCCKCGAGPSKITVKYQASDWYRWNPARVELLEELQHTCECSYVWITKCLDAKEKA